MKITIRDVAREAGVSISTVSYALNKAGEITKPSHKRVLEAAERLGYVPDPTARSLVMGTTNSIGVVIPPDSTFDLSNPYTLQMLSSLSRLLSDVNYWMSVSIPRSLDEKSIQKLDKESDKEQPYIKGILNYDEKLLTIIDIDKLLK